MSKVIEKYLTLYSEPEAKDLLASIQVNSACLGCYQHCLVIPVFQEKFSSVINVWRNLPKDVLIIIVANSYLTDDAQTTELFDQFCKQSSIKKLTKNIFCLKKPQEKDILLIDRCHQSTIIPRKNGVGLARKIGTDIALALIHKRIVLDPKIGVTDADVLLPSAYFEPKMEPGDAALIYPFKHFSNNDLNQEILLYEISMLYYSAGVKWSGSPYGFTTIGSLIVLNSEHYAQVRGFPKKNAGEDFYLLNKLAKVGNIRSLECPTIEIEARLSNRVPFGTGPALRKIKDLLEPSKNYKFYSPIIFKELRSFLGAFSHIWDTKDVTLLFRNNQNLDRYSQASGFYALVEKRKQQTKSVTAFNRCLHEWFDALKTLRFIHRMRDLYPSVGIMGIKDAPFVDKHYTLKELREQLANRCLD